MTISIILYIFITLAIRNSKIGFSLSLKFDGGAAPLFHITPKVSWQNNRQFFFSLLLEVKPPNDRGCPSSVSRLVDLAKGGIFTSMLLSEHKFSETIVLIGAWKRNFPPFWKLWQTDQPTDRPTDRPGHRKVSLINKLVHQDVCQEFLKTRLPCRCDFVVNRG